MKDNDKSCTKENKMATAPLGPLIVRMSLPTIFTMMVASLYNIVDSVYIARLSPNALTALSLAFPVQTIVASVASGIGTGVCALASQRLGAGDSDKADAYASQGFSISLLLGVLLILLSFCMPAGYMRLFSHDREIVAQGISYLGICMGFSFAVFVETVLEKVIQASGNMLWPMYFGVSGLVLNLILDPVMIFGFLGFPAMGITGAALATGISQTIAMVAAFLVVLSDVSPICLKRAYMKPLKADMVQIVDIALPIIIQQSMSAFTTGLMDRILIGFGTVAVNVYNVFFRIQNLFMKPVLGINTSVLPILSYNYGAGNKKRLLDTLSFGTVIGVILLILGMLPFLFCPKWLLYIFGADASMLSVGIPAFRRICLYFPFAGATIVISAVFAALSKSIYSMYIALSRQLFVLLPAAWLLSRISLASTWWCYLIAEVFALLLCLYLYYRLYQLKIRNMGIVKMHEEQSSKAMAVRS